MGHVNWIAVALAGLAGGASGWGWYRYAMPVRAGLRPVSLAAILIAMLIAAVMLGHNFARVGAQTLTDKPWLYWMMSVGFALWFIAPALAIAGGRHATSPADRALEAAGWIVAFAAMGTAFYLLR
jgi:hypothetical protein